MYGDGLENFVREYCRIDSDENIDIEIYISMAVEYLLVAGIAYDDSRALYKMAVALLVAHWIENRQVTTSENNTPLKYSLQHIITQLKYGDY